MKKTIIIAALVLIAGAASAQERAKRSPEESAKARTERLATVLELTPEQKAKVQALHEQQAREAAARMAEMEKKRAEHDAQMKGILTAEQYAKWQAMNEQRKERMHERRKSDASKRQR